MYSHCRAGRWTSTLTSFLVPVDEKPPTQQMIWIQSEFTMGIGFEYIYYMDKSFVIAIAPMWAWWTSLSKAMGINRKAFYEKNYSVSVRICADSAKRALVRSGTNVEQEDLARNQCSNRSRRFITHLPTIFMNGDCMCLVVCTCYSTWTQLFNYFPPAHSSCTLGRLSYGFEACMCTPPADPCCDW